MGIFDKLKKGKNNTTEKITPIEERDIVDERIKKIQEKRTSELHSIMNGSSASYLTERRSKALDELLGDNSKENEMEELLRKDAELRAKRREERKQQEAERERKMKELAEMMRENSTLSQSTDETQDTIATETEPEPYEEESDISLATSKEAYYDNIIRKNARRI